MPQLGRSDEQLKVATPILQLLKEDPEQPTEDQQDSFLTLVEQLTSNSAN
jgi:hypothetical protein